VSSPPTQANATVVVAVVSKSDGGVCGTRGDPLDERRYLATSEESEQYWEYCFDDVAFLIRGDGGQGGYFVECVNVGESLIWRDTIIQCFNKGDLVWIHGFLLLILPSILTRRIPITKIGIFLQTFLSSEIFRTL